MGCQCNNRLGFSIGMGIATAFGLLFFVFANRYIPIYVHDRGFEEVTCTVEQTFINGNFCCDVTFRGMSLCTSVVPCTQIVVSYAPPGSNANRMATLYDDFHSSTTQRPNANCSFYHCPMTYQEARTGGNQLVASYSPGRTFTCYRNPENPMEVLPTRMPLSTIILSTVIPAVCAIIGFTVGMVLYSGALSYCSHHWDDEDEDDDEEKDRKLVEKHDLSDSNPDGIDACVAVGDDDDEMRTTETQVEAINPGSLYESPARAPATTLPPLPSYPAVPK